jgi:hypothetical protein
MDVTESQLATALEEFWLVIRADGREINGPVADADGAASVLYATLCRIAALRGQEAECRAEGARCDRVGGPCTCPAVERPGEPEGDPFNGDQELTLLAMVIEAFDEMGDLAVARCMSYLGDRYPPE